MVVLNLISEVLNVKVHTYKKIEQILKQLRLIKNFMQKVYKTMVF